MNSFIIFLSAALALQADAATPGQAAINIVARPVSQAACSYYALGDSSPTGILNQAAFGMSESTSEVQNRINCAVWALDNGADPNKAKGNLSPLILAVTDNQEDLVKHLIQHKANVNVKDDRGATPVFWAATYQEDAILKELLAAGADPVPHEPLYMAASKADAIAVKTLLATHKIPVNQTTKFSALSGPPILETALDSAEKSLDLVNKYDAGLKTQDSDPLLAQADAMSLMSLFAYPRLMNPQFQRAPRTLEQVQKDLVEITEVLKQAGWTCALPNCGIDPELSATEVAPQDNP